MKITVEISEVDLKDVMRFSGEKKRGPAITKFVTYGLMLKRRMEMSEEVTTGKFRVELPNIYEMRARERRKDTWNTQPT